jgi:hypothetical protein
VARLRWAIVLVPVVVGVWIALAFVPSIENCPSCPGNPCPCSTDYRFGVWPPIIAVAILAAILVWVVTRRRAAS